MSSELRAAALATAALLLVGGAAGAEPGVPADPPRHAFTVVSAERPRVVLLDSEQQVRLTVRNDGETAWTPGRRIRVGYHWITLGGEVIDGVRTDLERRVAPGAEVSLRVRLRPPARSGLYRLQWDMVEEQVVWFFVVDPTPEQPRLVLVLPSQRVLAVLAAPLAAALLALLGIFAFGRRTGVAPPAAVALSDLVWCGVALYAKPFLLYTELGRRFTLEGYGVAAATVAPPLLLLLLLPQRIRPWASWAAAALATFFVWAHVLYLRFFDDVISSAALLAAHQAGDLGEAVRYLSQPFDLALLPDLLLGLALAALLSRRPRPRRWGLARVVAAVLLLLLLIPGLRAARAAIRDPEAQKRNLRTLHSVKRHGLYGYQAGDLAHHLTRPWRRRLIDEGELRRVVEWFESTREQRAAAAPWGGVAAGRNLIAIQVESLQQFVLGLEIRGQEITPHLNRLSADALVFPWVFDQTARGRSSAGEFVIQTSILPLGESVAYEYPANRFRGLGTELRDRGYATLSAIPYRASFWNRHVMHPAFGFESNLFVDDFEPGQEVGWGLNDRDFLRQMLPRIGELRRPFFAWLTTLTLHYPYGDFPDDLRTLDLGRLEGTPLGHYLHGIHLFDRAFGELYRELGEAGLLADTVVAVWGDHGSGLLRDPGPRRALGIGATGLDRFLAARVPFLVWVPGDGAPRGRVERHAGQTDIAPTLLALFGVDPGPVALMGKNLLGPPGDEPTVHPAGRWVDESFVSAERSEGVRGGCWDRRTLARRPAAACREGGRRARRQIEIADRVLEFDLQDEISRRLAARP